jgi:lipid II:glycine glycyltransferase (peptidoglycan interpeptide bridge formation enzyme)
MVAIPVEINWHSDLPVYASKAFLKTVGDECGWIGGANESGKLRCVLPYSIIRRTGLRMVRFRVETIPLNGGFDEREEKSFLNSTIDYFRSTDADLIIPSNNTALFRTYPDGALAAPYGTFIKNLDQSEEALWNEVASDYRQNIRKATRAGVHIKSGTEYLDSAYNLFATTLRRSGADIIKNHEDFRKSALSLGENIRIFVAECDGVIQACLVSPFSQHTAYDWYSGTVVKPVRGAMHLLIWEAIREFRVMGVKRFNFQGVRINPEKGSKQEGIMNFKMRFGGKLVRGYMWKYPLHPLKSIAYSLAVRLLKGGDIVDQERHKLVGYKRPE